MLNPPIYRTLPPEVITAMGELIKTQLSGKSDQGFFGLDCFAPYVTKVSEEAIMNLVYAEVYKYASLVSWKKEAKHYVDNMSLSYAMMLNSLNNGICICCDMTKPDLESSLYTRNVQLLSEWYKQGIIKEDPTKCIEHIIGAKTEKSFVEGSFLAIRLEVEDVVNGKPIIVAKTPKSLMRIGSGEQFLMIPIENMSVFCEVFNRFVGDKVFYFEKQTAYGLKGHKATLSIETLKKLYKDSDPSVVESRFSALPVGYDMFRMRYYVYNPESSLYELGIASFRPEMLNAVRLETSQNINTSMHNVNFMNLRGIFRTAVHKLTNDKLDSLGLYPPESGFATRADRLETLDNILGGMSNTNLYSFMVMNPQVFGDLKTALATRERVSPKILKASKKITLPSDGAEAARIIYDLASTGIVKVIASRKNGNTYERFMSNNPDILARMLGTNYVKEFESIRGRLKGAKAELQTLNGATGQELESIMVDWNLVGAISATEFVKSVRSAILEIDSAIERSNEKMSARQLSPSVVILRDIYASGSRDFFVSLDCSKASNVEYFE